MGVSRILKLFGELFWERCPKLSHVLTKHNGPLGPDAKYSNRCALTSYRGHQTNGPHCTTAPNIEGTQDRTYC